MRLGLCGDDSGELELIFMSSSSSFEIRNERNLSFDFRRFRKFTERPRVFHVEVTVCSSILRAA